MSDDAKKRAELAARLRKALGLATPSFEEADAEMAAAEEVPMSRDEINRIADAATEGPVDETYQPSTDYSWMRELETDSVSDEMVALHRNRGEEDPEVKRRIEELRKKALENDEAEDDESGLEDSGT